VAVFADVEVLSRHVRMCLFDGQKVSVLRITSRFICLHLSL